MHKKLLLLFAGALAASSMSTALAQPTWLVQPAVASQYMFRGVRLGGPSFQPTIEMNNGPLKLGVWANVPISDKVVGQSDPELDFYGAWTITLVKDKLTLVPGATFYYYPNADETVGFYKSTFEPNLALNWTAGALTLTPKVYYDAVLQGPTFELGAAYVVPLKGTELDFSGTIGTLKWDDSIKNSTPETKNWGDYWSAGVAMPFEVTKNQKLTVGWAYTRGSNNNFKTGTLPKASNGAAVGRGVVTVSYGITF